MESAILSNVLGIISIIIGIIGIVISLQIKKKIDNKDKLIESLISNTRKSNLLWKPFAEIENKEQIVNYLDDNNIPCDWGVNTIRESQSYYISNEDGYILLLEIFHGFPEVTSPEEDTLALIIYQKNNEACSLSDFEKIEQYRLKDLKSLIQKQNTFFSLANEIVKR